MAPASWVISSLTARRSLALGRVWQIVTYAFVHTPYPGSALLWFAVEMYMLFAFGREVERFIGHRAFIVLYALLLWVPTVFLTVGGSGHALGAAGSATLHFGIFIAFAAIYPNVEMLLRIQAKWVALVLVAIGTLAALAAHDWAGMIMLWVNDRHCDHVRPAARDRSRACLVE